MATRANVSDGVFLEAFATVEECYLATYLHGLERLSRTIAEATAREDAWLERVRSGLVALLGFFDDEPRWARLLLVESPLAGSTTFECRQRLDHVLAGLLEPSPDVSANRGPAGTGQSRAPLATLTGELVVGGVFSVVRTSLLEEGEGKLVELAPSLMAFIVAPQLGQVAAQAELNSKPSRLADATVCVPEAARAYTGARATELPIRATHRTTLVLRAIAHAPYSNNREIAQAAGLADEGQTSKLLTRLERRGVIKNVGVGAARGEPNAWLLTSEGRRALALLGESFAERAPRRASRRLGGAL